MDISDALAPGGAGGGGGALRGADWGNGHGATLFNTVDSCCVVAGNFDSNYAMVPSIVDGVRYLTLVGGQNGASILTERFEVNTGLRDTTYGLLKGSGPDHRSWSLGPSGVAYAAALDEGVNKVVVSGGVSNEFIAARFNNDGMLDTDFGSGGSIKIDFGTTNGITTDGARTIVLRKWTNPDDTTTFDILVGGYTLDAGTGRYKIALVDLLDDHFFHVQ